MHCMLWDCNVCILVCSSWIDIYVMLQYIEATTYDAKSCTVYRLAQRYTNAIRYAMRFDMVVHVHQLATKVLCIIIIIVIHIMRFASCILSIYSAMSEMMWLIDYTIYASVFVSLRRNTHKAPQDKSSIFGSPRVESPSPPFTKFHTLPRGGHNSLPASRRLPHHTIIYYIMFCRIVYVDLIPSHTSLSYMW